MPGSGATLNRAGGVLLANIQSNTAIVTSPLTSYGVIAGNDSGMRVNEARDMTKWTFTAYGVGGAFSGYSISIYGINDPLAYAAYFLNNDPAYYQHQNLAIPNGVVTNVTGPNGKTIYQPPASSWILLDGPATQGGTGPQANPLTTTAPVFQFSGTLLAVRAVLTGSATPSGVVNVAYEVAP